MLICESVEDLEAALLCNAVAIHFKLRLASENNINSENIITDEDLGKLATLHVKALSLCHFVLDGCNESSYVDVSMQKLHIVLDFIGRLPSLRHLEVRRFGTDESGDYQNPGFSILYITSALQSLKGPLHSLVINEVDFRASSEEDISEFADVLGQMRSLRGCHLLQNFSLTVDEEDYKIDRVLKAISSLPLLREFTFESYCWDEKGYPVQLESVEPINQLFKSPSIETMSLENIHLENHGLKDIACALKNNTTLRNLHLRLSASDSSSSAKYLSLLADALQTNKSLECLELEFDPSQPCPGLDVFLEDVARALTINTLSSLTVFVIEAPCAFGNTVEEAFLRMLETANFTLEKLSIRSASITNDEDNEEEEEDPATYELLGPRAAKISMLLRLNRRGQRKYLMTNREYATRDKWVDALANMRHDLDALHYYLHTNPWLCGPSENTTCQQTTQGGIETSVTVGGLPALTAFPKQGTLARSTIEEQTDGGGTSEYDSVMANFQKNISTCLAETHAEVQHLNRKHCLEKKWLEDEVLRLREENALLKSKSLRLG